MAYLIYPNLKEIDNKEHSAEFTQKVKQDIKAIYDSQVECWGTFAPPYLVIDSDNESEALNVISQLNKHVKGAHKDVLTLVMDNTPFVIAKLDLTQS